MDFLLMLMPTIYEPQEDSFLLQEVVKQFAYGKVLDIGTGSGIQAFTAAKLPLVKSVLAIDINPEAIENLSNLVDKPAKVKTKVSDLFSRVKDKYDTIIFNPPYLPQDSGIMDLALYGGKKGWEVSARFFAQAGKFLDSKGQILFLFSSYTNKEKIDEIIRHNLFEFEQVASEKFDFFEELLVYRIKKSNVLRQLEKKKITGIKFLAKGKRGIVFEGKWKSKRVAIKTMNPNSTAIGRIDNEAKWLVILNKHKIGAQFYFSGQDYLVMEFLAGERIDAWIGKQHRQDKVKIVNLILDLLKQCYEMDKLKMSKEEMHHPYKHILILSKKKTVKPVMIDFERCHNTNKPTNVTQFLEFICRMEKELKRRGINFSVSEIRGLAQEYRESENIKAILGYF